MTDRRNPSGPHMPRYTCYLRRRDACVRVVSASGVPMTLRRAYHSSHGSSIPGVFVEFAHASAAFFLDEEIVRVDEFPAM